MISLVVRPETSYVSNSQFARWVILVDSAYLPHVRFGGAGNAGALLMMPPAACFVPDHALRRGSAREIRLHDLHDGPTSRSGSQASADIPGRTAALHRDGN